MGLNEVKPNVVLAGRGNITRLTWLSDTLQALWLLPDIVRGRSANQVLVFWYFVGDTTSGLLATGPVFKNVCGEARARSVCAGSCRRRRGSEWVKADGVTVLSVLLGAVPAHLLLPPSLRAEGEHRAGATVHFKSTGPLFFFFFGFISGVCERLPLRSPLEISSPQLREAQKHEK
ncbi:hypothetical protein CHARACLAT_011145 [Characodon lateralis]|uniref:Uncharacterized protein n=1 Tax=Characodon lateralis TaxID=208331 RepID=A0ABU7ETU4_9TELE|nr:hypothetical protein [Characodon lateralis]